MQVSFFFDSKLSSEPKWSSNFPMELLGSLWRFSHIIQNLQKKFSRVSLREELVFRRDRKHDQLVKDRLRHNSRCFILVCCSVPSALRHCWCVRHSSAAVHERGVSLPSLVGCGRRTDFLTAALCSHRNLFLLIASNPLWAERQLSQFVPLQCKSQSLWGLS